MVANVIVIICKVKPEVTKNLYPDFQEAVNESSRVVKILDEVDELTKDFLNRLKVR